MGQIQSDQRRDEQGEGAEETSGEQTKREAAAPNDVRHSSEERREDVSPMEALVAEATAYSDDENESLEVKAQKALECPCVAGLRSGPCGIQFTEAFLCFMKSTAKEKGSDCVHPFVALQDCIKANPDAFSKDILDEDGSEKVDEQVQDYKIIPPSWSVETKEHASKL